MYIKFTLACMLVLLMSCEKDRDNADEKKTATQLLTKKEWILTGAGFDDNNNGVLDPSENTIQDCQKDNSYIFKPTGTGSLHDNALSCGVPVNNNFNWRFLNNETQIEIVTEKLFVFRLNENEMILSPDLPNLTVDYILTYRH
jgi:hypothetical protein